MLNEALAAPSVVARQLSASGPVDVLAATLAVQHPHVALTVARGSSDHAASYFAAEVDDATLPLVAAGHPALDPIAAIQSFYVMAAALAQARGRDPDTPRHLSKITETN